jgi:hypothetical protein
MISDFSTYQLFSNCCETLSKSSEKLIFAFISLILNDLIELKCKKL